jgi:apolipoprotein N-acyltransferase
MNLAVLNKLYPAHFALKMRICLLLSLFTGVITAFAMPPWNFWFLLIIGLSALYILLINVTSTCKVFFTTWCFFFGYFLVSLSWIGNALLVDGNEYRFVWPLAVCGLPALLSLFPAFTMTVSHKFFNLKSLEGYIAFVVSLSMSEWLRGHLFTGFPWNLIAYSWSDKLSIIQSISIGGVYFLSLLTIFWASVFGYLLGHKRKMISTISILLLATITFISVFSFGVLRLERLSKNDKNHDLYVSMIQANIKQEDKWNANKSAVNLKKHIELSAQSIKNLPKGSTVIVIWPETAITQSIIEHPVASEELKRFLNIDKTKNILLMTGILRYESSGNKTKYYNSLVLYNQDLIPLSIYNKSHLVPFGEYIPYKSFIPLKPIVEFNGFQQGEGQKTVNIDSLLPYSPLVCYEIIFPGKIVDKNVRPEWIVNVTNDAWYGISAGPYQHYAMALFRAIEEGIPVVRTANTGISSVIGPYGNVLYKSNIFEQDGQSLRLPKKLSEATLYAQHKDLCYFIFLSILSLIAIIIRQNR